MPELPEVETVRRTLEKLIIGKEIEEVDIYYPKIIRTPNDIEQFRSLLNRETVQSIGRRGKYLLFYLESFVLISHLRMEGRYQFNKNRDSEIDKHTHIVFRFKDGTSLSYRDVRKFGTMDLIPIGQLEGFHTLNKLGQEPLDQRFDLEKFKKALQSRKVPIKQLLLNQEIISGLGNIYVDDSLAYSKINPATLGSSLTDKEIEALAGAIKDILNKAIENGGSTIRTFESLHGKGSMQDYLIVYGREGKPCIFCDSPIKKVKLAGRGTHFCPECQKLKS